MESKLCGAMMILALVAVAACVHAAIGRPAHPDIALNWPHAVTAAPWPAQLAATPVGDGADPRI